MHFGVIMHLGVIMHFRPMIDAGSAGEGTFRAREHAALPPPTGRRVS
jgi:hypothetical protein